MESDCLYEDTEQNFKVVIAPCLITKEFSKCILAKLQEIEITDKEGQSYNAEVFGQFSETGLLALLEALRSAPLPIPLDTPDEIRHKMNYEWVAHYDDNTIVEQFPKDGGEHHMGHVDLHRAVQLWVMPRDPNSGLPLYCLNREVGLMRAECYSAPLVPLDLPFPYVDFHIEYDRRVTKTFTCGAIGFLDVPTQVTHQLGWRVDTLHGDDHETTFVIGIEDEDGSWQIVRKEPLDSRHFGSKQIEAEHGVRIIDPIGVVA